MTESQLNTILTQENLPSFPKPGEIYLKLFKIFPLQKIKNKNHHSQALIVLTKLAGLLQKGLKLASQEKEQILDYMDALGLLVEEYEKKKYKTDLDGISGSSVLEYLMEEHSLKQVDLIKELGTQSIVSEILSGKRRLNSQQILSLSKRFGISPSAFFP